MKNGKNVIIGGGPAGLTAAYELAKHGERSVVLEADQALGGLSRTCEFRGYRFDVGGHRFFTKVDYVQELWEEILGEDFLWRPRLSRIHYRGKLFDYPLKPLNALRGLGIFESVRVGLSYIKARVFPHRDERTFEHWVCNRFGRRLFEIFFKTYTEKVWGMKCSEISAEWAAQRIKNLDLLTAVRNALLRSGTNNGEVVTTLIDRFQYPRHGPGQMWEACARKLADRGSEVKLGAPVTRLVHDGSSVQHAVVQNGSQEETRVEGEQFFSSMPIRNLLHSFDPPPPKEVLAAADRLRYRDFLTVALIIDKGDLFPDNWIYIHSDDVRVGRVQNYKNWSPEMVPDPDKTSLGLEYFVQEGDDLWTMTDEDLVELGRQECAFLGLAPADSIEDGTVLRMRKAYPVYDDVYKEALGVIRGWLDGLGNLQLIGRNGQHRYNNQDHSMMTGVYAAQNVLGADHDVWDVNVEEEYHEERSGNGDRLVPQKAQSSDAPDSWGRAAFGTYDRIALGVAVGSLLGLGLFVITAATLLFGENGHAPNLSFLGSYLLGYTVTWKGAFLVLVEGSVGGFAFGWFLAYLINVVVLRERLSLVRSIAAERDLQAARGEQS